MAALHAALPPKLNIDTARSHFYQSPTTPSACASLQDSMLLSTSSLDTTSALSSSVHVSSNTSRKRSRNEFAEAFTPRACPDMKSPSHTSHWSRLSPEDAMSPPPLADTRYVLAGGGLLGTPTAAGLLRSPSLDADAPMDMAYRRGRGYGYEAAYCIDSGGLTHINDDYFGTRHPLQGQSTPGPLKRPREDGLDWPRAVFSTALAVVGGVWNFCTTPFRGFSAGSDRPYLIPSPADHCVTPASPTLTQPFGQASVESSAWTENPPVPRDGVSTPRAAKKSKLSHTSHDGEEPRGWMLVSGDGCVRSASPSTASAARIRQPEAGGRRGGRASVATGAARPASAADLRSPATRSNALIRHGRRGSRGQLLGASPKPSLTAGHAWRHGDVGPGLTSANGKSPVAKETARYVQKMKKRERDEERELKRFNRRLKDMIREGQEALGARVEIADVVDAGEDSGMNWA